MGKVRSISAFVPLALALAALVMLCLRWDVRYIARSMPLMPQVYVGIAICAGAPLLLAYLKVKSSWLLVGVIGISALGVVVCSVVAFLTLACC